MPRGTLWLSSCFSAATVIGLSTALAARSTTQPAGSAGFATPPAISSPEKNPAAPAPKIRCAEPAFSFPDVWAGEKVEHTFLIRNEGNAVLIIPPNGVRPACGCTITGSYDHEIEPGREGKIPVALNTEHQRGRVNKQIFVESNDSLTPRLQLTLSGTVKAVFDMQPITGASWGQYTSKSPETIAVKLTNNVSEPWRLVLKSPASQPQPSAFDVTLKETQSGKTAEVLVTLRKPLRDGATSTPLRFETGLAQHPELTVPASIYCPPALQIVPNAISGVTVAGREFHAALQLIYNREGELNIEQVTATDPTIRTEVSRPTAGTNRYTISVTLPEDFAATIGRPAMLRIQTDRKELADHGVVSVPIRVRSQSTQPARADRTEIKKPPI